MAPETTDDQSAPKTAAESALTATKIIAGPAAALLIYLLLPDASQVGLSHAVRATAAVGAWMAVWWLTEAVNVSATALLPIALLPLTDARTVAQSTSPYGHHLIFLFMGGFILAQAMERWGLHKRIALLTLMVVGSRPRNIVAGFMGATAFLSMWISNTATAIMMLPIAASVTALFAERNTTAPQASGALTAGEPAVSGGGFAVCTMLGIAYAASIGGVGTIIGTPPNLFLVSFIREKYGVEIGFAQWLKIGLPFVLVFLPLAWLLLTRVLFRLGNQPVEGGRELFRRRYRDLGLMNAGEKITGVVFLLAALSWISRPYLSKIEFGGYLPLAGLTDTGIAVIAALALFVAPAGGGRFVMDWPTARKLPWGILILFGGGLSLAAALDANGVSDYLGLRVQGLGALPQWLVVGLTTAMVIFLTELTSNTATTATLIPLLAGVAPGLGIDPYLLIVPATLAASCAFMMPVATPPNAVVFGSGHVTIPQMAKAGLWLNLMGLLLITALGYLLVLKVLV